MGEFLRATYETLQMVVLSSLFALVMGLPLGLLLVLSKPGGIKENRGVYGVLDLFINLFRSFPFMVLMIILFPVSRLLIGKTYGTEAAIVPLAIAAAPFVARIMEQSLNEVDRGVVEAAQAMGSRTGQIIFRVMLPEALPSIISGITITVINLIGYSAMSGAIGGGGLGDLAVRFGLHRRQPRDLWITVLILIAIVQIVQFAGNRLSRAIDKR
ncbi:MAG TPA: ABC transporter permease [Fastidiosipila sp.]|nr:ABC transporter permease [Fastidiosipila sp.]